MTLQRDARGLGFLDAGEGAPTLLFIHGWGGSHRHFRAQIEHFASCNRVLAVDLRGFGESAQLRTPTRVEDLATDLLALCADNGCDTLVPVGHSLGGAIALALAAAAPDRVVGSVLLDPAIFFPERSWPRIDGLIADLAGPAPHEAGKQFASRVLFLAEDDPEVCAEVLAGIEASDPKALHAGFAAIRAFDSASTASRVHCPLLCVDAARPFVERAAFERACPQVAFQHIETCGHFLMQLAPERVCREIERFMIELGR